MLINFDYDGVIADSFRQILELTVNAQRKLGVGRTPLAEDFYTIENLTFEGMGRVLGIPEDRIEEYGKLFFGLQAEKWEVTVFPEMVPVMQELSRQHTLVIITSSRSDAVLSSLKAFELESAISKVLGADINMTKAERIQLACKEYNVNPGDAWMVGDAISDIREGKKAGVKTVAVTWGFQHLTVLKKEKPDFIAARSEELLEIFGV